MALNNLRRASSVVGLLLMVACGTGAGALPTASDATSTPLTTADSSLSPTESAAPSATAAAPSPSAEPTVAPTLSAEPIDQQPEASCTNSAWGYSLSYPADWYVLPTSEPASACTSFGSEQFDDMAGASIKVSSIEGACYDQDADPIAIEHFTVDGFPTIRREFPAVYNGPGYVYVVDRNPVPECGTETHLLLLETDHDAPGDYATNKRVLDRIVSTLAFDG